jgi:hypothetical protein
MSAPANTGSNDTPGVINITHTEATLSSNNQSSDRVREIDATSSSQPNAVDKYPSSVSILSIQHLEQVNPDSARTLGGVPEITPEMQKREKWVLGSMSILFFMVGWNDGTLGPLLPRIQEWYGVSDVDSFYSFYRSRIQLVPRSTSLWCR